MTRIAYMGGEQMKMRRVAVLTFLVLAGLCHAGADDPLCSLANGWGKGTIIDFRKTVYKNVPALANKGGAEAVEKWCLDLWGYPDLLASLIRMQVIDSKSLLKAM